MRVRNNMHTLTITHLNPGSLNHTQAVLENKHYNHTVTIHKIYWDGDDKIVEYDTNNCIHWAKTNGQNHRC